MKSATHSINAALAVLALVTVACYVDKVDEEKSSSEPPSAAPRSCDGRYAVCVEHISPSSVRIGDVVTITGRGFLPDLGVLINFPEQHIRPILTRADSVEFVVPEMLRQGQNPFRVLTSSYTSGTVLLNVEYEVDRPYIDRIPAPSLAHNQSLYVEGGHFEPRVTVGLLQDGTILPAAETYHNVIRFDINPLPPGEYTLQTRRLDSSKNSNRVTFWVLQ